MIVVGVLQLHTQRWRSADYDMHAAAMTPAQEAWAALELSDEDRAAVLNAVHWKGVQDALEDSVASGQPTKFQTQISEILETATGGNTLVLFVLHNYNTTI